MRGTWALDNGRREPKFSGVNNEIEILSRNGCYADFTFPAFGTTAQPRIVNTLFYATDNKKPKSYSKGVKLQVGNRETGDIAIFQGPLFVDWNNQYIDYGSLESFTPFYKDRINNWMSANVHVIGRPEWVFIKLHTHGMQNSNFLFRNQFEKLFICLNDYFSKSFSKLHYVTAREAYNIAKAAENGENGDPNIYRDYLIAKPMNKILFCNKPYKIIENNRKQLYLKVRSHDVKETVIKFNELSLKEIHGSIINEVKIEFQDHETYTISIFGMGSCDLYFMLLNIKKPKKRLSVQLPCVMNSSSIY